MTLNDVDHQDLQRARRLLENPGLAARLAAVIGMPLEKAIAILPRRVTDEIGRLTQGAIHVSLRSALATLRSPDRHGGPQRASEGWHTAAASLMGAASGFLGAPALAIELPISLTIMMRSIADIARSEGADLEVPATQLDCVQVLALGGSTGSGEGAGPAYLATREALAQATSDAINHVGRRGLRRTDAPALVRLITTVAERFSVNVTERAAAQAIPVIGAASGALVNGLFIDHFQGIARGHFIIRRLERKYGGEVVQEAYTHYAA